MGLVCERGAGGAGIRAIGVVGMGWIRVRVHEFGEMVWIIGCEEKWTDQKTLYSFARMSRRSSLRKWMCQL
jgi:hypothetical protein